MPAVTDAQIAAYVAANIGNPAAIAAAAAQFGVTVSDLSRATGAAPAAVTSYFATSNVPPPADPIPAPVPLPVKVTLPGAPAPVPKTAPKPADQVIADFVVAHIDQPAVIAQVAQSNNVSVADLARATGVQPDQVTTYFAAAGVDAPNDRSPDTTPAATSISAFNPAMSDWVPSAIVPPALEQGPGSTDYFLDSNLSAYVWRQTGQPVPDQQAAMEGLPQPPGIGPGSLNKHLAFVASLIGRDPRDVFVFLSQYPEYTDELTGGDNGLMANWGYSPLDRQIYAALAYTGTPITAATLARYGVPTSDAQALLQLDGLLRANMARAEDQSMPGIFIAGLAVMGGFALAPLIPGLSAVAAPAVDVATAEAAAGFSASELVQAQLVDAIAQGATQAQLVSALAAPEFGLTAAQAAAAVAQAAQVAGVAAFGSGVVQTAVQVAPGASAAQAIVAAPAAVPAVPTGFTAAELVQAQLVDAIAQGASQAQLVSALAAPEFGLTAAEAAAAVAQAAQVAGAAGFGSGVLTNAFEPGISAGASAAQAISTAAPAASAIPSASTLATALNAGKTLLPALLPHPTAPGQVLPIGVQRPIQTITAGTDQLLPILLGVGALLLIAG